MLLLKIILLANKLSMDTLIWIEKNCKKIQWHFFKVIVNPDANSNKSGSMTENAKASLWALYGSSKRLEVRIPAQAQFVSIEKIMKID